MIPESPTVAEFKTVLSSITTYGNCLVCNRPFLRPGMEKFECPVCSFNPDSLDPRTYRWLHRIATQIAIIPHPQIEYEIRIIRKKPPRFCPVLFDLYKNSIPDVCSIMGLPPDFL